MKFQNGYIGDIPYWGLFSSRTVAQHVIHDLNTALNSGRKDKDKVHDDCYVLAFMIDDKLYVARNQYHALVVAKSRTTHIKNTYQVVSMDGVLVLSKDYMDDLPGYKNAESFCKKMSEYPVIQYCIPLNRYID